MINQHLSNTIPIFLYIWYTNTVNKLLSLTIKLQMPPRLTQHATVWTYLNDTAWGVGDVPQGNPQYTQTSGVLVERLRALCTDDASSCNDRLMVIRVLFTLHTNYQQLNRNQSWTYFIEEERTNTNQQTPGQNQAWQSCQHWTSLELLSQSVSQPVDITTRVQLLPVYGL